MRPPPRWPSLAFGSLREACTDHASRRFRVVEVDDQLARDHAVAKRHDARGAAVLEHRVGDEPGASRSWIAPTSRTASHTCSGDASMTISW